MKHILTFLTLVAIATTTTAQDTIRVNALVIDTAVVFYPGPRCETCMIGNGKPTAVAVARDILQVITNLSSTDSYGIRVVAHGYTSYQYFELSGARIDERRVFLIKD